MKKRSIVTEEKPEVAYDEEEENITSEEEEEEKEDELDERKHQKLLEAISSLGGEGWSSFLFLPVTLKYI